MQSALSRFPALAWLVLFLAAGATAEDRLPGGLLPVINISALSHIEIGAPAELHIADQAQTLAEAMSSRFEPLRPSLINQGVSVETYWLRFRLVNDSPVPRQWVLQHETSYLDDLIVHYADGGEAMKRSVLSDHRPFAERPVPYPKLAFRHTTPAHSFTDLYLRFGNRQPDTLTTRFLLWEADRFHAAARTENLVQGAYLGVMVSIMAIALLCAALLKRLVYVHYAAFLLFSALLWAALSGLSFECLWPQWPRLHNEGFHIIFLLVGLTAFQFSKTFLEMRELFPRLNRMLAGAQLVMAAAIVLRVFGLYEPVLWLSYTALALLSLLPLIGWLAYRRGLHYARWYTWAWVIYALFLLLSVMSASGHISGWGMQPLLYAQLGSLLEALLLTVAMGERLLGWDRERRRALELALHDPLTGLGNRRLLSQAYASAQHRFGPRSDRLVLAIIDLDDFKQVNDAFGHDAGDQVLQDVAQLLLRHTRTADVCVRYGGEEFAILLQAPSMRVAVDIVERIRSEFASVPTVYQGHAIQHTFSAGLAVVLSDEVRLSQEEMLRQADAALYRAKGAGRNRTTVFREHPRTMAEETLR